MCHTAAVHCHCIPTFPDTQISSHLDTLVSGILGEWRWTDYTVDSSKPYVSLATTH